MILVAEKTIDTEIALRLRDLLGEVSEGRVHVPDTMLDRDLKDFGMDSVMLLSFLVAIEDAFMMEWSENVDRSVFRSVTSLSLFLAEI